MADNPISEFAVIHGKSEMTMDFPTAIANVIAGKRITKLEWADRDTYGELRNTFLMLHRDGQWFQWIVNEGDLMGKDWIVC